MKNQRLVKHISKPLPRCKIREQNWKKWVEKSKVGNNQHNGKFERKKLKKLKKSKVGNNQHNVSTSPLTADSRTVQGKKHKGAAYNREYP